ncbi:branched-chain amino acid ABC transporter permease [Bradyrhizobium sp.]|uniref:branched-chain amino acid ABC transporter permease n=1 Tax=Bradyrhizobium sp. TaxID=376 RepID=UPI001D7FD6DC|nr:branched-chain amino acid ABC transporter permease [Bradyrhizobium sp.]MBV8698606.1 branched-chain amino acid ABC transporter permease [Bradyrhizobium sp.]MBV8918968.1 branched-chain amino acid ABC transporter permease [Bradyrhizobium sp.]MBV9981420.1 branched-chain amino acid ABC transporter permease [Bradyrhizobium sp.]
MTTIISSKRSFFFPEIVATCLIAVVAIGAVPLVGSDYLMDAVLTPFLALALAAVGLNLLTGYAGQVSLGSAAFLAVGAYAAYNFSLRLPALPLLLDLVLAGTIAAAVGIMFGLPSLRLRGFYLAVSTLAAQFFVQWALTKFGWFSNDNPSGVIDAPVLRIGSVTFTSAAGRYLFSLGVVTVATLLTLRLLRSQTGRNFIAVRDHEVAAKVIGVPVLRTKLLAFGLSSFLIGVAGVLWAFAYLRTVEPAGFNLDRSFQILFIIIIGGLASLRGAFVGAAFIVVFPLLLSRVGAALLGSLFDSGVLEMSQRIVIGTLIITFLIAEPRGLIALWDRGWARLRAASGKAIET